MKYKIYTILPPLFQNLLISFFNFLAYKKRYGGNYRSYLAHFEMNNNLTLNELKEIQASHLASLIEYAINKSSFYNKRFAGLQEVLSIETLKSLPILTKEELRKNASEIYTIPKGQGIISKTGGTTGKSLEVIFTPANMQERFAMLDNFRRQFGYKLGKKTAWFSGKALLTKRDINRKIFWKTDYFYKVRYYSTFHINRGFLKYYIEDLIKYKPEYLVGFPSTIYELAKYGMEQGIDFPAKTVKAIFPTAESVTPQLRRTIESYFKTSLYDQYASSEGAPFIFECKNRNLHMELQSGVFEVLDDHDVPSNVGRLVITSFTSYGTPLIRYEIGDRIELSNTTCECGNNNPLVKQILGRIDDYIYSEETGKINLGNISNTLKDVHGIQKFQVIQNQLDSITIKVVIDEVVFSPVEQKKFLRNWRDRVGTVMKVNLEIVEDIPMEKSGKFRMVKNSIKHIIS